MTKITELGFCMGVIVETVVSTYNAKRQANAAPIGVMMKRPNCIALRIFNSSLTYNNIKLKRCAVINLISDAEIFYHTAFKETNQNARIPQEWFEKAETVDAPQLQKAEALIEVTVVEIQPFDSERTEVTCKVQRIKASSILPKAYCRAQAATIEAIIHATRVKVFVTKSSRQNQERTLRLLEKIKECNNIVNCVAPNSCYSEIMADLNQRIESWRTIGESLR